MDALNAREAVSPSGKVNKHDNGGLIMRPPPQDVYLFTIIIWGENEMGFYLAEMEIVVSWLLFGIV